MKRDKHNKFMEKKIKRTPNGNKKVSDSYEKKNIALTILIAVVILAGLLINLALEPAPKEPFAAIYLLDLEKQTENFPKTVVLGENSTFVLWVGVINQNDTTELFQVRLKRDNGTAPVNPSPANTLENFKRTLLNKEVWEFQVTINLEQLGDYRMIFELWYFDETDNDFRYSGNWVSLSLEVISI